MKKENPIKNIHIGSIIKAIAANRGITGTQLAKMIYCHTSTIHYIYKNKNINAELLWKIAVALNYDFFTEVYSDSLPETVTKRDDSETTTIFISSKSVSIKRNMGITKIMEFVKKN
jgi:transcriptional regulator with XRE-family HTH domain